MIVPLPNTTTNDFGNLLPVAEAQSSTTAGNDPNEMIQTFSIDGAIGSLVSDLLNPTTIGEENVTTIPPTLSITYNVTITDSNGTQLYSNQFEDSDGILDLELVPTSSSRSSLSSSNQTGGEEAGAANQTTAQQPHFVTWGPDLTDQEGVASDGTYHVQGPVMTENEDYTITVSITSIDDAAQPQPPSDDFLIPFVNFTADSTAANFLFLDPVE